MARIAGVDLPRNKRADVALTYIFGIGTHDRQRHLRPGEHRRRRRRSRTSPTTRSRRIRQLIDANFKVEGELRRQVAAGHPTEDRDRLVPGHAARARPSRPRTEHADERADPQGSEAHRRRQEEEGREEGLTSGRKEEGGAERVRRRERKNIAVGQAHIKSSFNNTIISITDPDRRRSCRGRPAAPSASRARASRRRSPRSSPPRRRAQGDGARHASRRGLS